MATGGRSNLHVGTIRPPLPLLTRRSIGTGCERSASISFGDTHLSLATHCHALPLLQMRRTTPFRRSYSLPEPMELDPKPLDCGFPTANIIGRRLRERGKTSSNVNIQGSFLNLKCYQFCRLRFICYFCSGITKKESCY